MTITLVRAIPVAVRSFSATSASKDSVTDLYLNYIRNYKPAVVAERTDLPQTFAPPKAPAKPEFETESTLSASAEESMQEEEWPPLKSPIDDPANYPDAWDYSAGNDGGALLPQRTRPFDFDSHHGH
ncbi:hypothetical protein BSLG_007498 [Batrachochytrium salamandrivorans]|nr:hypothetical protein BSLG_007498 [Batrachochytrium salamandrivorans]